MPLAYVLTRREVDRLVQIATARNDAKEPEWTRRETDAFDDRQVNILGAIGEYAAAAAFGLDIDPSIHSGGDNGIDLVLPSGATAAVKYNHRWNGYLLVEGRVGDAEEELGDLKADNILLTHGMCLPGKDICHCPRIWNGKNGVVVFLAGWLTKEQFIRCKSVKDWGIGVRHCVRVSQLRPISELMALHGQQGVLV